VKLNKWKKISLHYSVKLLC